MIYFTLWLWEIRIEWHMVEPDITFGQIHPYMDFNAYIEGDEILHFTPEEHKAIINLCKDDKAVLDHWDGEEKAYNRGLI
jgi:hypothetical protein